MLATQRRSSVYPGGGPRVTGRFTVLQLVSSHLFGSAMQMSALGRHSR